jgi:hypothetical protein
MDGYEHMNTNIECWWIDNGQRKTEVLGENPSSLPLHAIQIPHVLLWNETGLLSEKPVITYLSYGAENVNT